MTVVVGDVLGLRFGTLVSVWAGVQSWCWDSGGAGIGVWCRQPSPHTPLGTQGGKQILGKVTGKSGSRWVPQAYGRGAGDWPSQAPVLSRAVREGGCCGA